MTCQSNVICVGPTVPILACMAAKRRAGHQAIGYKVLGTSDSFSGQVVASNEPAEAAQ